MDIYELIDKCHADNLIDSKVYYDILNAIDIKVKQSIQVGMLTVINGIQPKLTEYTEQAKIPVK